MTGSYVFKPICSIKLNVKPLTAPIGPSGDMLTLPFRITGGSVTGMESAVLSGTDFAVMYADEKLTHEGKFVVAHPDGNVVFSYQGSSRAGEGAYDGLLDGRFPYQMPALFIMHSVSTRHDWRSRNREPLVAVGTFDSVSGQINLILLSIPASEVW